MLESWREEFEGKHILIWGYGLEGRSTYRFIRRILPDQELVIADKRAQKDLDQIQKDTVHTQVIHEDEICFEDYDLVMKSPGIVPPAELPLEKIHGQAPMFLKHYRNQVVGVTGTKGKSTTTSLIHAVLSQKYPCHLVGNIGNPCFDVIEEMEKGDLAAFEISCHQLEYSAYSPHIAVYLNLYQEHLDHYGTFEQYGKAKDQIFLHQEEDDLLIIHQDIAGRTTHKNTLYIGKDIYAEGKTLTDPAGKTIVTNCALIGDHNYQNLAVARYIGRLYGISDEEFTRAAASFQPLHHRLEPVGEKDGVLYINDSISTIGPSAIRAMEALPDTEVILIGGKDRGIEYKELEEYLLAHDQIKVILMYATGKRILTELQALTTDLSRFYYAEDLAQAVALAKTLVSPGRICLLSPAASSYDHFRNFEERGEIFGKLAMS
ncbi:MAG: UDP-N-acetylmuramoyl-L-alanine--D-glutamate ligase [Solobacterium sp.]|nr:UDP-N-acetylmuramoyl-L-alanine--D-glutamate ligase [Solobacterium sp.]